MHHLSAMHYKGLPIQFYRIEYKTQHEIAKSSLVCYKCSTSHFVVSESIHHFFDIIQANNLKDNLVFQILNFSYSSLLHLKPLLTVDDFATLLKFNYTHCTSTSIPISVSLVNARD